MKCKNCGRPLKYFYYAIGGLEYCKSCALDFVSEIRDFRIKLNRNNNNGKF